jgi:hypothetical protein
MFRGSLFTKKVIASQRAHQNQYNTHADNGLFFAIIRFSLVVKPHTFDGRRYYG